MRTKLNINNSIQNAFKNGNDFIYVLVLIISCVASKKLNYLETIFNYVKPTKRNIYKIYEALLQIYLFCGFPASIESLKIFNSYFSITYKKTNFKKNKNVLLNGQTVCKKVYLNNYSKLMKNFEILSLDLKHWMITEGYGKVLSRKGISLKHRELLNVAILATNYYEHQLYSHIKGSFNTGSAYNEIRKVIETTEPFNKKQNVIKSLNLLEIIYKGL